MKENGKEKYTEIIMLIISENIYNNYDKQMKHGRNSSESLQTNPCFRCIVGHK